MPKIKEKLKYLLSHSVALRVVVVCSLILLVTVPISILQLAREKGFGSPGIDPETGEIISEAELAKRKQQANGGSGAQGRADDGNGSSSGGGSGSSGDGTSSSGSDSSSSSGSNKGGSSSNTPSLATDVFIFDSDRAYSNAHQIFSMKTDGSDIKQLTDNSSYDHFFAKISPDRTKILYHRAPAGSEGGEDYTDAAIWVMNYDGTNHKEIRKPASDYGWSLQGHAEWSPDGTEIALTGGSGGPGDHYNVHILDANSGSIKRTITNFQTGVAIDPSWSPDGQTIVFAGCDTSGCFPAGLDIYSVPSGGGSVTRHTNDSKAEYDPYISPDGKTVAWIVLDVPLWPWPLGEWGIKSASWTPTQSFNSSWIIRDGNVNSKPDWSADSQQIYFHRIDYSNPTPFQLYRINKNGSGLTQLEPGAPGRNKYPDIH